MDRREIEDIERFVASVGKTSLYDYYGASPETPADELEGLIRKRRTWAQGQQSNPKYKAEALFVIKHNAMLRKVLIEESAEYLSHLQQGDNQRNLDTLTLFIRGALVDGILTAEREAAILRQGKRLEVPAALVTQRVEELLAETGARREGTRGADGFDAAVDYYELLGISEAAPPADVEAAYRARYRYARTVMDREKSASLLHALDDAWRILNDPAKRAQYDVHRATVRKATEEIERRPSGLLGLLSPPPEAPEPAEDDAPEATVVTAAEAAAAVAGVQLAAPPPVVPIARTLSNPGFVAPISTGSNATLAPGRGPATPIPPLEPVVRAPEPPRPPRATATDPVEPARSSPVRNTPTDPVEPARSSSLANAPTDPGEPPSPAAIQGRTIGIAAAPQNIRTRGPRLAVDAPETIRVRVAREPVRYALNVRNTGQGRMPGKVTSDRDWLEVRDGRLNAASTSQTINVEIRADKMPRGTSVGTVTVVTDHGERKAITFQVFAPWITRGVLMATGVVFVVFAIVVAATAIALRPHPASVPPLTIHVDPPADGIFLDDLRVGSGATLAVGKPKMGEPIRVRIEADGFEPHEELVTLQDGRPLTRDITLTLSDGMKWSPPAGAVPTDLGAPATDAIKAREGALARCFAGERGLPAAEATYAAWVTNNGAIRRVDVSGANFDTETALPCIRRVFRATHLAPFSGDYARIELPLRIDLEDRG